MARLTSLFLLAAGYLAGSPCAASSAVAREFHLDPGAAGASDENPGTAARPLRTLARALELARAGDTILLATGEYPAVAIRGTYDPLLTIAAAEGARPVLTAGVSLSRGGGVRLKGLTFTWIPGTRPASRPMTPFIEISSAEDIEVSDCEIFDDPGLSAWVGWALSIRDSQRVTIRDCRAHHFYFGFSAYRSRDVVFRNLDVALWSHEDGIRITECEGPVLIEGCHITNSGLKGARSGHVDGIQSVFWNENVTIRNCLIHGLGQGIGAFGSGGRRRLRNWRVEGCLIYDVYAPHACSIYDCDGVTVVNNTFPQNRPFLFRCTGAVIRNNIIGLGGGDGYADVDVDYNLWLSGPRIGAHDLTGDARFLNAPILTLRSDMNRAAEMSARRILFRGPVRGTLDVGDEIEVLNTDGSARDGRLRKVTAAAGDAIEIDPPLSAAPDWAGVFVYKWAAGRKELVPDYRLAPDSPAIDSADGSVGRSADRDGHEAIDAPGVANTGGGRVKCLDRGAFEFAPPGGRAGGPARPPR